MIKPFLHIVFLVSFASAAQNLVPNGSFEDYLVCPGFQNDPLCVDYWYIPSAQGVNGGTSDVFNTCGQWPVDPCLQLLASAPVNCVGGQDPRTGEGYGGFLSYYGFNNGQTYKEYLGIKLLTALELGCKYEVQFFVSRADSCVFATNKIGAYFGSDSLPQLVFEPIPYTSKVEHSTSSIVEDKLWVEIKDTFTSNGTERFMFIGSADEYSNMIIDSVGGYPSNFNMYSAYYYVDDVQVLSLCTSEDDLTESLTNQVSNVFTPNNDLNNDFYSIEGLNLKELIIFNRWGEEMAILNEDQPVWDGTVNGNPCSEGTYFYRAKFGNQILSGFIELIR